MKCAHCGNEMETGSVFCKSCGKEAQIVPDYNVLEDDILTSILEEKKVPSTSKKPPEKTQPGGRKHSLWGKSEIRVAALCVGIAVCIGLIAAVYCNSYAYHMRTGSRMDDQKEYQKALEHYRKAADRKPDESSPLAGAGHDYLLLKEYELAEEYLQKAIDTDPACESAYLDLIQVYVDTSEYQQIDRLLADIKDDRLLQLLEENLVTPPVFSVEGGEFTDDVTLELSSVYGYDIYWTSDGRDPTQNGIRYQDAIVLKDGNYTVRAACRDDLGKFGRIVEQRYKITYEKPAYPKVTPMQGTFDVPTQIFMEAPGEGCRIYYTWDGTTPTMASPQYTGPIDVLEGNNVLSVIVIDKHGLCSDILKCNYKYLP